MRPQVTRLKCVIQFSVMGKCQVIYKVGPEPSYKWGLFHPYKMAEING